MQQDSGDGVSMWYTEGLDLTDSPGLVWMTEERVFGEIAGPVGAFFTPIRYTYRGIDYEIEVENDDFIILNNVLGENE